MNYNSIEYDYELESKLNEMISRAKEYLMPCFTQSFTYDEFVSNIVLLLDISGSMNGTPIKIGLLYMLMMIKIFRVKECYTFSDNTVLIQLNDNDIDGRILHLLKKVYRVPNGSTNLNSAFTMMEQNKVMNKKVIIITDGDCDPVNKISPFANVVNNIDYDYISTNSYVIANVSIKKLSFPYLSSTPNVCYINGNNPKTICGFIKAAIISVKTKIPITPMSILKHTLSTDELLLPIKIADSFSKILDDGQINNMYNAFLENRPPAINSPRGKRNDDDDDDDDDRKFCLKILPKKI